MNKKVMILIVVIECVLAILLIAVLGMAIETYFNATEAEAIYFTTADGTVLEKGMLYKEKEGTVTQVENENIFIEVARPDRGYQLHWLIIADNTSDKSVTFLVKAQDPNVEVSVDENGFVFFGDDTNVTVTISTKNGRTASVLLIPRQGDQTGTVTLE